MILKTSDLVKKYKKYANPLNKISEDLRYGKIVSLIKGLYEDDKNADPLVLGSSICQDSYVSFETALSYYGLIPEAVYVYTLASLNKRKNKKYKNYFGTFITSDIPSRVFNEGIVTNKINGREFKIASKEKALCDLLYKKNTIRSQKDIKFLLFDDLRIDEDDFKELNFKDILSWEEKYKCTNIRYLCKLIRRKYFEQICQ